MELHRKQVWNSGEDGLLCMIHWQLEGVFLSPPKASKIDDLSHAIQAWENLEQRHQKRTGDQLPKDMRLAFLLSMCPTDLERVDGTAALVSRLRVDEGTHRDSHEQSHPWSCSNDDGKSERRGQPL